MSELPWNDIMLGRRRALCCTNLVSFFLHATGLHLCKIDSNWKAVPSMVAQTAAPSQVVTLQDSQPSADVVRAGDTVILDTSDGKQTFVKLRQRGSSAKIGKSFVSLDSLLGKEYGCLFEVSFEDHKLIQIDRPQEVECQDWREIMAEERNNKLLEDVGAANQTLTAADIHSLRKSGKSGEEIVSALLQNSATYSGKTQFSQEKYRRKKARKYVLQMTLRKITARSLCEVYFSKAPVKTCHLRVDSLALLLTLANIGSHAHVLLVDSTGGLVTGAVAERMGGYGSITVAHIGHRSEPSDLVDKLNFPPAMRYSIRRYHINRLLELLPGAEPEAAPAEAVTEAVLEAAGLADTATPAATAAAASQQNGQMQDSETAVTHQPQSEAATALATAGATSAQTSAPEQPIPGLAEYGDANDVSESQPAASADVAMQDAPAEIANGTEAEPPASASASASAPEAEVPWRRPTVEEALADITARVAEGFNSCIIAQPHTSPEVLIGKVLPLLQPSTPFVIFSNWSQPLAEVMMQLQVAKKAIALSLQESWLREYQVLPGRTHPGMNMSNTGGYILSGITVAPEASRV